MKFTRAKEGVADYMCEKGHTSVKVDKDLWKRARMFAIQHEMSFTAVLEEALRSYLK